MHEKTDFLFYTELDRSGDIADLPALTRRLVSFATGFGLAGNIWQQWLAYMIMTAENEFSLACERRQIDPDSTLMELAMPDMAKFMELMRMDPVSQMNSYIQPYKGASLTKAGARIGASSTGVSGTMQMTPRMIIIVVTMEEVAMAMVEMISPSSLLALTPFCSRALMAQGSFRLERLPVTKLR